MHRLRSNKGQSSIEFVVLTSFMILVFISFFIIVQDKMAALSRERFDASADEIMSLVVNEIQMATAVSDDYSREFSLPNNIEGQPYTIEIMQGVGNSSEIVIKYFDREKLQFLQAYVWNESTVGLGSNRIEKHGGLINITKLS